MTYICDDARHLVCLPYSVENLHRMAADLGIKRCWFHSSKDHPHYDIPKRRIDEIKGKCRLVSSRTIVDIVRGRIADVSSLPEFPIDISSARPIKAG